MSKHVINDLNDTGFFTFQLIQDVLDCKKDLTKAKQLVIKAIENYPSARKENQIAAHKLVLNAKSTTHLAMGMSSFILAYQGMSVQ